MTALSKQIAVGIACHGAGHLLLHKDGIGAAKALAHSVSWLSRAIQRLQVRYFRSRSAIAPIRGRLAEIGVSVGRRIRATARQDNVQNGDQKIRQAEKWAGRLPSVPSWPSMPPSGVEKRRLDKPAPGDTSFPAARPLMMYAAVGRGTAACAAHAISAGRSNSMRRSDRTKLEASLWPMLKRQRQDEAVQRAPLTMHDIEDDKSRRRLRDWAHSASKYTRSRTHSITAASLAPVRSRSEPNSASALLRQERNNEVTDSMPASRVRAVFDEGHLNRVISDQLERIAMRPGSGMTGYDPRVSPSFPGAPNDV